MSDPAPTMPHVNAALRRLVELASRNDTLAQMEYLDLLATYMVVWTRRPNDVERMCAIVNDLIQEIVKCQQS